VSNTTNTGGSTPHQYALPKGVTTIQELIKAKGFSEDQGGVLLLLYFKDRSAKATKPEWTELQDLLEGCNFGWSDANIFKAIYRMGTKNPDMYELNKAEWFAKRQRALTGTFRYDNILQRIERLKKAEQNNVIFNERQDLLGR